MTLIKKYHWIDIPLNLAVTLIYLGVARLGLEFATIESTVTIFWPPGGFALAVLLLAGPKYLPSVYCGAFTANLIIGGTLSFSALAALGNTLETFCAYWLLTQFRPINLSLKHLSDLFKLLVYGAIVSTLISALIGTLSLAVSQQLMLSRLPEIALYWWMGNTIGIAFLTPLILLWHQAHQKLKDKISLELVVLFALTISMSQIVIFHWCIPLGLGDLSLAWLLPFIIWSGLRAGQRATSLLILLIFLQALWSASHNIGHYANAMQDGGLINFWLFGMMIAVGGMVLAAISVENKNNLKEARTNAIEMKEKEDRLSLATVANGVGIWDLNPQTGKLIWDDSMFSLFNIKKENFSGAYDAWVACLHPEDSKKAEQDLNSALSGETEYATNFRIIWPNGEIRIIKGVAKIFRDKAGTPTRMLGISADITELKRSEDKVKLAASVFTHAHEGIVITDTTPVIIDVNDTFIQMTGYSREELIGINPRILQSDKQPAGFYRNMWKDLNKKNHWSGELWSRKKDGEVFASSLNISAVSNEDNVTTNFVAMSSDITLMKEYQGQLERNAHYDVLTSLPNRVLLADRLSQAMLHCARHEESIAVIFLDLDSFKFVNDTYGHNMGDELLIALSIRMKEVLRDGDSLARIGGDEFVAVLTNLTNEQQCEPILQRLLLAVSSPIIVNSVVLNVSASIGVTLYPQDNVDADQLMRHADQAMYMAKETGKNCYHIFDTAQDDAVKVKREGLDAIRHAIDNHQFVLYYQPKVNMKTGKVIGTEALIRWEHPDQGLLSPAEFLPIVENTPMSIELGEWVIDTALSHISQWQKLNINYPLMTSVNIAALQLQQPEFVKRLTQILSNHPDVEPHLLELEVLETSAIDDLHSVSTTMNACMELGVNFALDDFGTGYSSLTYLRRLPASMIKIDQSFIRDMLHNADDLAIVEGVIALAKSFKRNVIAEGVETIEHGTVLLQLGCDLAQGYGIAKPMPASDIQQWLSSWKPDKSWQV